MRRPERGKISFFSQSGAAGSTFMVLLPVPFPDVVKIKVGLLVAALASTYFVLMK